MYLKGSINVSNYILFLILSDNFLSSFKALIEFGGSFSMLLEGAGKVKDIINLETQSSGDIKINKDLKGHNDVISRMVEFLSGIQVFKSYNMEGEKSFRDFKKESIRTEVAIAPFVLIFQTIVDLGFPLLLLLFVSKFMRRGI
ncbi:hypothetical protein KPL30_07055 [Clostridium algidicarnis]|nr:hypothetical protein [Clostridium algidicarnis]MBU3212087.1 hypothetical protein [Clostridium algidicarnis]MBU3221407.1 hypothetical protein [Clostridium algidicarnis]